jgi:very-long-chain ceramide synthase
LTDNAFTQTAKILKYFEFEAICNVAFIVFILTWFITRHIVYPILCWSIYQNVPAAMAYGCYSGTTAELYTTDGYPNRFAYMLGPYVSEEGPFCMNQTIKWIFLSFLLAIEALSMLWFTMILRVAIEAIRSGNAEDERSDDEDEEEEEVEVEVSVSPRNEALNGVSTVEKASSAESSWRRANAPAQSRRAHGGILGDSDRKALLGRIGCDKPTHD